MNLQRLFFGLITIFLIIVTGCSNGIESEEQLIEVQKRVRDQNNFEDFKKVTDREQVLKVKEILNETDWEDAKVSMSRPPDYQFVFQFKNPEIEAKSVLHKVWISPNKDKLEIVQGDNQYAQLTKENSTILFEIITGDKLAELK
ncbi:hypothetical protein [Bacillus sp. CECT 9360]|uniref:hypothetical protein n=1 Tax=Bacillus sp. CECT 9360 TaxID=2845821 RepID=UPI001E2C3980|nr:hypothetical protein [Bacillus sp. CECT 9360]